MKRQWRYLAAGVGMVSMYSLVASTALALFLPQAKLSGLTFSTANIDLRLSNTQNDPPTQFFSEVSFPGAENLVPGKYGTTKQFWIHNMSGSGGKMNLTGQFLPGDRDWEVIKNAMEVNLRQPTMGTETGWKTLAEWSAAPIALPETMLEDGTMRKYQMQYRMPEAYPVDPDGAGPIQIGDPIGAEMMNKISGQMKFVIDGTLL